MLRTTILVFSVLAFLPATGTAIATATPPKEPSPPGTASPSSPRGSDPSVEYRPLNQVRLGPNVWFGLVAELDVSTRQQDELTPVIRRFIFDSKAWAKVDSVRMTGLLAEARKADPEERAELMKQIREIRSSRPRFDQVKAKVMDGLNSVQRGDLIRLMQSYGTRPSSGGLSGGKAGRPAPSDEKPADGVAPADASGADGKSNGSKSNEAAPEPKPWAFQDDTDPGRHVDPSRPAESKTQDPTASTKDPEGD